MQQFLSLILSNLQISNARTRGATPIKEVAELCGFSPTSLVKDCRADKFEHCNYGDGRSMTPDQVEKFLAKVTRGGDYAVIDEQGRDEMAEARAASLKSAGRQRPRKDAA
ncbi:hypothetical protein [Actinoplanes sp. L3-i22]|uniref:hypothetical protein n=1 Tax=Actinoplanes sp. L3-i22 TaxID=2836373 RepID=UPI001C843F1F|nr:hypothetical protein [Actinoplanes sp. L3-i22]